MYYNCGYFRRQQSVFSILVQEIFGLFVFCVFVCFFTNTLSLSKYICILHKQIFCILYILTVNAVDGGASCVT